VEGTREANSISQQVPQGLPKGIEKTRITIEDNIKRETKMRGKAIS
jgi:hypothetical protein